MIKQFFAPDNVYGIITYATTMTMILISWWWISKQAYHERVKQVYIKLDDEMWREDHE